MLEKDIETRFVKTLRELGCLVYKFVSPGNDGVPDRIVILPDDGVIFIELKTENGKLSARQKIQIDKLRAAGQAATVLYGEKEVDRFLRYAKKLKENRIKWGVGNEI